MMKGPPRQAPPRPRAFMQLIVGRRPAPEIEAEHHDRQFSPDALKAAGRQPAPKRAKAGASSRRTGTVGPSLLQLTTFAG